MLTGPTKLEELRRHMELRKAEKASTMVENCPSSDSMCGRKNAIQMIRDRCAHLRAEEERLLVLLRVLELGSEKYGDGAQDAELALWHLITDNSRPSGRW